MKNLFITTLFLLVISACSVSKDLTVLRVNTPLECGNVEGGSLTAKHIVRVDDETLDAVAPILNGSKRRGNQTSFYNLMPNRVAEVSERHLFGIAPLGSLLVSIDQHYDTPEHPLRCTMGSEVNLLSAIYTIDGRLRDTNGDLVFKAFNRCAGGKDPSNHGGFNKIGCWKSST